MYACMEHQHTERCVSVLGCISIDGPCFVKKVAGLQMDARTYISHLGDLNASLVVWEPREKGWRFAQLEKRDSCGAVRIWFDSQTSLKRIPWPAAAQYIFPMKKLWKSLIDECNFSVLCGGNISNLWDHNQDYFVRLLTQSRLRRFIYFIPDECEDILEKIKNE